MVLKDLITAGVQAYRERKRRKKLSWLYVGRTAHKPRRTTLSWVTNRQAASHTGAAAPSQWYAWRRQTPRDTAVPPDALDSRDAEQAINRHFTICAVSAALATAGTLVYPPLGLLSVPGIVYVALPIFHSAYKELLDERKVTMTMVYSMLVIGTLILRSYVAMSLAAGLRLLSQKLLLRVEDHSKQSLIHVLGEQPRFVWICKDTLEVEIPFEALQVGDTVVVHAGETVPVDGTIAHGLASIDQHVLTGESQPVEKGPGDPVFASTVVLSGTIGVAVEKAGQDTVAAQIGEVLNRTADFRSAVQLRAQAIGDKSAPPVLVLSAVTLPLLGPVSAVSLLYASFGYDLRITAPISALNFLRLASGHGMLIKDGRALEVLQDVDTIVFDKTGTLTLEQPHIGNIYPCGAMTANEVLTYAAAAEYRQTHPIARAILQEATRRALSVPTIDDAAYEVGYGMTVHVAGRLIRLGSARFMGQEGIALPTDIHARQAAGQAQGYSFVYVAVDDALGGAIELHPTVRPEVQRVLRALRQRHLSLYVISGDQEEPTRKLAHELGIQQYVANTLPENKAALIEQLQNEGKTVCFVGDGINDAIALKQANVAVSLLGAATVATDTAQIILMDQTLNRLDELFDLAHRLKANMRNNVMITVISSAVTVGGVYFFHIGVLGSLVIYNLGLVAGVTNATLPLMGLHAKRDNS